MTIIRHITPYLLVPKNLIADKLLSLEEIGFIVFLNYNLCDKSCNTEDLLSSTNISKSKIDKILKKLIKIGYIEIKIDSTTKEKNYILYERPQKNKRLELNKGLF